MRTLIAIVLALAVAPLAPADLAIGDTVGYTWSSLDASALPMTPGSDSGAVVSGTEFSLSSVGGNLLDLDFAPVSATSFTITGTYSGMTGSFTASASLTDFGVDDIADFTGAVWSDDGGIVTDPTVTVTDADTISISLFVYSADSGTFTITVTTAAVPEPSSYALMGLIGLGLLWRRRQTD